MHEPMFRIAARQEGVVLRRQLLRAGMSSAAIARRVDDGWLTPVFPGAYCVAAVPITRRQRIIAAVLLHPGSAADDRDAALMLGLEPAARSRRAMQRDLAEPVRIALPHPTQDTHGAIAARRQLHRDQSDIVRRFGINVVAPSRLVIDMAGRWPTARLERLLDTALASRSLDLDVLVRRHLQLARRGRKGVRRVDALIDARVDGRHRSANRLETAIRRLIEVAGFPEPERQHCVVLPGGRERYLDLAFAEHRIAIEIDGYRWHASRTDWAADQVRANELTALGWRILRVTDETLANPAQFLAQLRELLRRAA